MRLCASRSCLIAGAKPRRVLPRAGAITSRFESLVRSGGVETNELPLAPRDATQTRVWSWSRFRHDFQSLPHCMTRKNQPDSNTRENGSFKNGAQSSNSLAQIGNPQRFEG